MIRFWNKVNIKSINECWEWRASKFHFGHGMFQKGSRTNNTRKIAKAHRVAYEFFNGEIPEGLCVCHSCDNPPCCNPNHLFLGTHIDNMKDMVNKKRSKNQWSNK